MDQELYNQNEPTAHEASFGGSRLRMEFEHMEEKKTAKKKRRPETILFSIAFVTAVLLVTMVLIGIGAEML